MQLAYVDGGDCYGPDAVGIIGFFGPKPEDAVAYYLDVARRQRGLFCPRPDWLMVGAAYDTTNGQLRTSWIVRTPVASTACRASTYLPSTQVEIDLSRPEAP